MNDEILRERLTAVRQKLADWQVDALLITGYANRRWLSGFTGSNCRLLVTADQALLATDFRYYSQAEQQAPHFTLFRHERRTEDDERFFGHGNELTVGFEADDVTVGAFETMQQRGQDIHWHSLPTTLEPLRAVKTAVELEKIQAAAAITDQAMAQVPEIVRSGMSERQIAWELEKEMREAGADGMAFPVLVASGPNAAHPHHATGDRKVTPGDTIIIDMGGMLDGYRSDLTRSFLVGNDSSEQFMTIYEIVKQAQTAVLQQAKANMGCRQVDAIARDLIAEAGHQEHFGHGLGHGVGLDIHEEPFLSTRAKDEERLLAGMTLTVEPGIYIPGWGGIRLEELTVVTTEGLRPLSHSPYTPIIPT